MGRKPVEIVGKQKGLAIFVNGHCNLLIKEAVFFQQNFETQERSQLTSLTRDFLPICSKSFEE
jgi:hypothetical protein